MRAQGKSNPKSRLRTGRFSTPSVKKMKRGGPISRIAPSSLLREKGAYSEDTLDSDDMFIAGLEEAMKEHLSSTTIVCVEK
jgi:hypothetical protein